MENKSGEALAPTFEDFKNYLWRNEMVRLAITEATHRFYYDQCFNPYFLRPFETNDVKRISKLHSILSTRYAGWRYKMKKKLERYHGWEDTTALNIDCNPFKIDH